jgi:hypothetical protein
MVDVILICAMASLSGGMLLYICIFKSHNFDGSFSHVHLRHKST